MTAPLSEERTSPGRAVSVRSNWVARRLLGLVAVNVLIGAVVVFWVANRDGRPDLVADQWSRLDPQGRCARALTLIRHESSWPIICRWRRADDHVLAVSFPPPAGNPPWDHPRIEVYVSRHQGQSEIARVIAHEMGHMVHTREPTFASEWLKARRLPPDTDSSVWTEDYAEVFAALFGPPGDWRAPTAPPSSSELADLRARFFA